MKQNKNVFSSSQINYTEEGCVNILYYYDIRCYDNLNSSVYGSDKKHITCFHFLFSCIFTKFSDDDNNDKDNGFTAKFVCKLGIGSQQGFSFPFFQYIWFSFLSS